MIRNTKGPDGVRRGQTGRRGAARPCEHFYSFSESVYTYLLADGQTGSGKTFTMYGKRDDPNLWGIAPRAMKELYDIIDRDAGARRHGHRRRLRLRPRRLRPESRARTWAPARAARSARLVLSLRSPGVDAPLRVDDVRCGERFPALVEALHGCAGV